MAIKYAIEKHAYAFPSKLLATHYGKHIYNVQLTSDTDNGNLIKRGNWLSLDLYEEEAVTEFAGIIRGQAANGNWYVEVVNPGDALFAYNVPLIAEDWTERFKNLHNFYMTEDEVARAHELAVGDVFELSVEGFEGVPAAGKSITGVTAKKLVVGA